MSLFLRFRRMCLLALCVLFVLASFVPLAAQQPDPTGAATGDRNAAVDGAGNSFMIAAPDPSDPDFVNKKKAYDEFQAQPTREPLAAKVADVAGTSGSPRMPHGR